MHMNRLKAPEGTTNVSYGGENYQVGDDGIIEVPETAVQTLREFGFEQAPAQAEIPAPEPSKPLTKAELKALAQAQAEAEAQAQAEAQAEPTAQ
jgi:hypothetical protein